MSTSHPTLPDDDAIQQQLVAYLDGELSATEAAEVELRLSEDADYRQNLQRLQRAWDLLDELPRSDVDESFTKSTVEMVVVSASNDVSQLQTIKQQRRWLGWMVAGGSFAVAALAGYLLISAITSAPNRRLIRDFAVIERLDDYWNAQSIDYLRQLDEAGFFTDPELPQAAGDSPAGDATAARRQLEQLSPAAKDELSSKADRFYALPEQKQDQLRRLHRELTADPDGARLIGVMTRYGDWLKTLPAGQRYELLALDASERLAGIGRIMQEQEAQRFARLTAARLPLEDVRTIFDWSTEWFRERKEEILRRLDPQVREQFRQAEGQKNERWLMMAIYRGMSIKIKADSEEIEALERRLSEPTRKILARETDLQKKQLIVNQWIRNVMASRARSQFSLRRGDIDRRELERFFITELSPEDRRYLQSLSGERMHSELQFLYYYYRSDGRMRGRPPGDRHPNGLGRGFGPPGDPRGPEDRPRRPIAPPQND